MNLHAIRDIAQRVRAILTQYANHPDSEGLVWHQQNNLYCMCAIASVFLLDRLYHAGLQDAKVVRGKFCCGENGGWRGHVWVEIPSLGLIVDVTATQFQDRIETSIPDILIIEIDSPFGELFIKGKAQPFFIRHLFAFWTYDMHPWGRINGVSHQKWLLKAWEATPELEAAA